MIGPRANLYSTEMSRGGGGGDLCGGFMYVE